MLGLPVTLAVASLFAFQPQRADAAVNVDVHIGLPVAPALVVVQPGVQVVENFDEEVYFTSGYYWVRRDDSWYRARTPRSRFVMVHQRVVPVKLVRMPRGQYVRYSKAKHDNGHRGNGGGHDDGRHGDDDRGNGGGKGHGNGKGHNKD
jgi:hypothetical protein